MTPPAEAAQRVLLSVARLELEEAERVARRESELVELRTEAAARPGKWSAGGRRGGR